MSPFWARTMSFRRYDGNPDSPALTSRRNAADPLSSRRAEITLDLKQEMAATDPREAVAIKGRDSRSRITSETELTTIHSSSVRVFIAEGQTKMQHSAYGLIVLLTLTAIPLSAGAAPAQADRQVNCVASVDAIRAEWRNLSHSSSLKASQRIATGNGRWLAGSQLNYAHVLIGRADNACGAGAVEQARGYVNEANKLLNPAPSGIMLSTRPGN